MKDTKWRYLYLQDPVQLQTWLEDLSLEGWTLARREEFPGFSHEIITKEVYIP